LSAASSTCSDIAAAALLEATTSILFAWEWAILAIETIISTAAAAAHAATRLELTQALTTLLDSNLIRANCERTCVDSSLEALESGEVNKGAILGRISSCLD
jgi:hypothetical protein